MKKQNVNNKLAFNKVAVIELNENQLVDINGGGTPAISSVECVMVVGTIAYNAGVEVGHWISKLF